MGVSIPAGAPPGASETAPWIGKTTRRGKDSVDVWEYGGMEAEHVQTFFAHRIPFSEILIYTMTDRKRLTLLIFSMLFLVWASAVSADPIRVAGQRAELSIVPVSDYTVRITVRPVEAGPQTVPVGNGRVLAPREWPKPAVQIADLQGERTVRLDRLRVTIRPSPLTIEVLTGEGTPVQRLVVDAETGDVDFRLGEGPVLGLGNGGQRFNRRGRFYSMDHGHRPGEFQIFGSRMPVPFLIGTDGWALFFHRPYNGRFDLREEPGRFLPENDPDTAKERVLPMDVFVTNVDRPSRALSEYTELTGRAPMPPKWALGYIQSHRNLAGPEEVLNVARTFREKNLPVDALIYLGTGFTPSGWNTGHGSFAFNPKTFPCPQAMLDTLHSMHYQVALHLTRPPETLHGSIPPEGNATGPDHVANYWARHRKTFAMGVDGWWPDMGENLSPDARLARHYMYRKGPLTDRPNERPFSLHRTGFAGMHRYGGWIWSGDVASTWNTLAAHVRVGINASLSTSPFWGSDIGGFYPTTDEFTGELYARWFQFGSFTPIFRAHGRVWHTRLPWGWNPGEMGPLELVEYRKGTTSAPDTLTLKPDTIGLHNPKIEPVIRKYLELRYRLMPYLYTTVRQAHDTGLPIMRAMWLHYPDDATAVQQRDQYLWGRDLLVAPVVREGATTREVYLPEGPWYDFWTERKRRGRQTIVRYVDLETTPFYVRAGTILPMAPVRQYTGQPVDEPMTLRIYPGRDGTFTLYEDDGRTLDYQDGEATWTKMTWDDEAHTLTIAPGKTSSGEHIASRRFKVVLMGGYDDRQRTVTYTGEPLDVTFE